MIRVAAVLCALVVSGCGGRKSASGPGAEPVLPGITVLLRDSLHIIEGRRLGLLTSLGEGDATRGGRSR